MEPIDFQKTIPNPRVFQTASIPTPPPQRLEDTMTWKTPKITVVCVGMEINMYHSAIRK